MTNLFIAQTLFFKHFQVIKGRTSMNLANLSRTSYPLEKTICLFAQTIIRRKRYLARGNSGTINFIGYCTFLYIFLSIKSHNYMGHMEELSDLKISGNSNFVSLGPGPTGFGT